MADFLDEVVTDVAEAAAEIPKKEKLESLAAKAEALVKVEDEIELLEEQLAERKREKRGLAEIDIPEMMNDIGLSQFKLSNGLKLTVKPVFRGKITEENADEAFAWLDEHGHGGIVKGQFIVEYRLDNAEGIAKIAEFAESLDYASREKLNVHFQTLSAFLREQITSGNDVPRDLLGVWTGWNTKVGR